MTVRYLEGQKEKLNYFINSGDRDSALVSLSNIKDIYGDIITLLNIETQD